MDRELNNQLPDFYRELKLKLEALDSMMLNNAVVRGGAPYLPLSEINDVNDLITTHN